MSGLMKAVGLVALLGLAACGGGSVGVHKQAGSSAALARAPSFGDAHPVAWTGQGPGAYPVHGIDLSRWQGAVDWRTARANGVSFAFIKATEGGDRVDPGFAGHWTGAAAAGVPRGAYHFYYWCSPASTQAAWFIANVPRERGALPPVLDLEWNSASPTCRTRPAPEVVRAEVQTWLNMVGRHFDQTPIIYTTPDFWEHNELWKLRGMEKWLRAVTRHPSEAYPGTDWSFWQYSGTGLVPGVQGPVDVNAFAGSREAWARWVADRAL
ncbi:glycoside hydrolase family 25 protein [Rubellimicrobium arenae]|uniref:glycoside hydrolase family 25 protein n=1 Tax=Rubellimicrobium arenae TaxID=2817372 RepID=UPI001B30F252